MSEEKKQSKWMYLRWFLLRFILVVYDIVAVNISFYLALLTRFYVAKEFHSAAGPYIDAFVRYAPFYTVFCLIVFACFKLYNGMWKYAGFNDLNRIVGANVICFIGHVCGTLLFVQRMPITFYCIGAAIQFCLIAASRFSYRLLLLEKDKIRSDRKTASVNAMVVGIGGTAKMALRELEQENTIRPVCVLNYKDALPGTLLDGLPVINGVENLNNAVKKYQVNLVIIASDIMPQATRERIKALCREENIEVHDYSGFFQSAGGSITLRTLAQYAAGEIELVINGEHRKYADMEQALASTAGRYVVTSISASAGTLVITLSDHSVVQNDLDADWVKDQEKETGEAISFF